MAIQLKPIGVYQTGVFNESAAEIVTYDAATQRLFVVNANSATVDVLDVSGLKSDASVEPTLAFSIDASALGGVANSVAVKNGVVAIAIENNDKQAPGTVAFFDTDGTFLNSVTVGALPDMLTFTPDGSKVLVANEGEPNADYTQDPVGSVSIIDLSRGVANAAVQTAGFEAFVGRENELREKGVRIFGPNASAAQDFEPEYIAVSPDGRRAFVTLQENNAFAVVDLETATVLDVLPLGYKDYRQGQPQLTTYPVPDLPTLDTTAGGQAIKLGGLSGLWYTGTAANGNLQFLAVPDRGPNGEPTDTDGDGDDERPFALPDYQARVVSFELNEATGDMTITNQTPLFRQDGTTPITGLPNIPGADEEPVDLLGNLLPYDELGADLEGIVVNPADGSYWMPDEYRPAIYHFGSDGVLIDRFVPQGTAALAGQTAGTFGTETLPVAYRSRRPNRGFEAIALDTDSGILYGFIQTPLAHPDRDASDNSAVIRMLGIDPSTGQPVAEYVYLLADPTVRPGGRVDKIGDAVYAGDGKFYALERDDNFGTDANKFLFEFDLTGATNLLSENAPSLPDGLTLEQLSVDQLIDQGIKPVNKTKVANLPSLGYGSGDKIEGLTRLPDGRLAVLNDNDFGLLGEEIPVDGTVPLNPDPAPVVLGILDFSAGNTFDASNRDRGMNLQNHPVLGMFQPDAIASYSVQGQTYYVTANEGDSRDYDGFSEEARIGDDDITLDPTAFPNAAALKDEANLGRLNITQTLGDEDGDGDYDRLYAYGARSFSIWDSAGNLVFDSGDAIERKIAELLPAEFNATNDENGSFDNRSDDKGPEPEALTIGTLNGKPHAFVGLERVGGVMVFDISNPMAPEYVTYANHRDFSLDLSDAAAQANAVGLGPEGVVFIDAIASPTGKSLLAVASEVSGDTTVYETGGIRKLQILHTSDLEGGVDAIADAPNFAAVVEGLETDATNQGIPSILLSAGDNYLPGPFFSAAGDRTLRDTLQNFYRELYGLDFTNIREGVGRFDISVMNALGFDASAVGNHEFDAGTAVFGDLAGGEITGPELDDVRWPGAQFPYLSTNLDFANSSLADLYTPEILPQSAFQGTLEKLQAEETVPSLAPATIIEREGDLIGVVGATTPAVGSISSTGDVNVIGSTENDMAALAAVIQPTIDALKARGVNKIVTVTHLQQFQLEQDLVPRLSGVDVAIAGGSDTILADSTDRLRVGDSIGVAGYPVITTNADGEPAAIVSTDGQYSYVGRLVAEFDANGVLIPSSINPTASGPYATDTQGVVDLWNAVAPGADPFAEGTKGETVDDLTGAVQGVVTAKDAEVFGSATVYLEGRRGEVRTEETNLGNLTADANLFLAQQTDPSVVVSIKNGGGIRDSIGEIDGITGEELPTSANPLSGKQAGQISQLDIEGTLRFNNGLTLLTLTATELKQVLEHGVSESGDGATPGRFPQVGGLRFSFDLAQPVGSRVRSLAIADAAGNVTDTVVRNGVVVGNPNRPFRTVTLDFLAGGGDDYPFESFATANPVDLELGEQAALAQYIQSIGTVTLPDTTPEGDTRIQNLTRRADTVLASAGQAPVPTPPVTAPPVTTPPVVDFLTNFSDQEIDKSVDLLRRADDVLGGLFDEAFYLATYPDVATFEGGAAIDHFVLHGQFERRQPSAGVNFGAYLANNPDVAAAEATGEFTLASHYVRHGRGEGRVL